MSRKFSSYFVFTHRPTRVTTSSATLIDNILTNTFFDNSLKKGIIKSPISDHFPIFAAINISKSKNKNKKIEIKKRDFSETNKQNFKEDLINTDWSVLDNYDNTNLLYETFSDIFILLYEKHFPLKTQEIKIKHLQTPWFTKGMKKSSKKKQKLYIKFLKGKIPESEYKDYKNLFEKLKQKSKQMHYSSLISKYQNNAKKTWQVMKEITGKIKDKSNNLPKMIKTDKGVIYDDKEIAEEFNEFFTNVGQRLAANIPDVATTFEDYLTESENQIEHNELSFEEFETAYKSLQRNKAIGVDNINCNIILDFYEEIKYPLYKVFKFSIRDGKFPDRLKIAKVTPVFKSGDVSLLGNYRPISVLPTFSKILEKIMYNRVYTFLRSNTLLYAKQFGFQKNTSTEHAIIQLVNDITGAFAQGKLTLGVFIDLSKAFDTVNHSILLKKLKAYGITGKTHKWFKSYLENRKQIISFDKRRSTKCRNIICGVPQGSILGPLLFLIYVNDLYIAAPEITAVMFADDTSLFLSDKNIENLFSKMNDELKNVSIWFKANKLSLNITKTKFSLFHPSRKKRNIPVNLPKLEIDNTKIKRECVTKFLGLLIDENLTWKPHIDSVNTKISKSVGILYKSRNMLNKT